MQDRGLVRTARGPLFPILVFIAATLATGAWCRQATINGRRWVLGSGPDAVPVIEVWGTPYEMGCAHGRLVKGELRTYYETFFNVIKKEMSVKDEQLDAAWAVMSKHIAPEFKEEMKGLAEGAQVPLKWVHWMHIIPDLSWLPPFHYQCSYYAAWGKAVPDGHLYQMRALDYWMEAHVQDKPAIILFRPNKGNAFATASWIGVVGAITGMNAKGIALSEIGDGFGAEHETMDAEPWIFMARRVLQYTGSLESAVRLIRDAKRMSSYDFLIGDGRAKDARQLVTAKDIFKEYDWKTAPHDQPVLEDVVYLSMAVGNKDYNKKLYARLKANYGNLTAKIARSDLMPRVETGDLHAVAFDATDLKMWVANAEGSSPAYSRPCVMFNLKAALHQPVPQSGGTN
jgi:predicted choloylglycine hydrolase